MDKTALLQGLTIPRPPTVGQVLHRNGRSRAFFFIGTCLWYLGLTLVAFIFTIRQTWVTGAWSDFWGDAFLLNILIPFLGSVSPVLHQAMRVHQQAESRLEAAQAQPLRQAAAAGDNVLAPLVTHQPKPSEAWETAREVGKWGPLKQPIFETREWLLIIGGVLILVGGIVLVAIPLAGGTPPRPGQNSTETIELIIALAAALFLIVGGILSLLRAWRLSAGIHVRTNAWGVRWRRLHWWGATRTSLDWHDARAFYTFAYERKRALFLLSWNLYRVYVLDAPETTLAWLLPERGTAAQEEAMHERLCSLIVERTGLPLRDLSAAVAGLEKRSPKGTMSSVHRRPASSVAPIGISSLSMLPQTHKKTRPPRMVWYALAIPFLFVTIIAGGTWGLQTYQTHQYVGLLLQVRSHKPLYHDPLTGADGDWAVKSPTANDSDSFSFVNRSYQLTGGFPMEAIAPGFYGNAAVEVTVRPLHWPQADDFQGVGLVLHTSGPYDDQQIVFRVAPDGYWEVGPASQLYDGYDHLRHGGGLNAGTSNRLTVIMLGSQYICFVNDIFLGIYQTDSSKTGQVGIFAESYHDVVAFNDFTIYPL